MNKKVKIGLIVVGSIAGLFLAYFGIKKLSGAKTSTKGGAKGGNNNTGAKPSTPPAPTPPAATPPAATPPPAPTSQNSSYYGLTAIHGELHVRQRTVVIRSYPSSLGTVISAPAYTDGLIGYVGNADYDNAKPTDYITLLNIPTTLDKNSIVGYALKSETAKFSQVLILPTS